MNQTPRTWYPPSSTGSSTGPPGQGDPAVYCTMVDELVELVRLFGKAKPHLVETLIRMVVQVRVGNVSSLRLGNVALKSAAFKPLVRIVPQNPQFFKICGSASTERKAPVNFPFELFTLHPNNTYQVSHIQPLSFDYNVAHYPCLTSKSSRYSSSSKAAQTAGGAVFEPMICDSRLAVVDVAD